MSKKQKVILGASLVAIVLGVLIIWGVSRNSEENLIRETTGLPESEWQRVIAVEEVESGQKVLTNKFDGYEITVPSDWMTPEVATSGGYGITSKNLDLNIFVLSGVGDAKLYFPETARFTEMETPIGKVYKTTNNISGEDILEGGDNNLAENSLSIGYLFPSRQKGYLLLCSVWGNEFEALASLCEKQILTFKIIK